MIGRPANLRKWAAGHLGRARPPKPAPGKLPPRPPTDLTPIAAAIRWVETTSPFAQRLAYERLMARYVPLAKRRDLKPPAWLRLVPAAPLPDLVIQPGAEGEDVFGPFRDRRAALRARDALHKHFRIRPCDFDFKPPTGVPDGLPADLARALEGAAGVESIPSWVGRAAARSLTTLGFRVDYVTARNAETLAVPLSHTDEPLRLFAAAWLGTTRLIDNIEV
mgnify:CR=1 FL=1